MALEAAALMGAPAQLLGALGDYVFVGWADGRVVLETPAPVTLEKKLAMSALLVTASAQAERTEESC